MRIQTALKETVLWLDRAIARLFLPSRKEQGVLLSFLFHGIFRDRRELDGQTLDPQQSITVELLGRFIAHFKEQSYRFISPDELASGLSKDGKYVLLTFDDGYFNNVRALPVLEAFDVPAVFFISSDHIKLGKAFWWDVVYRELKKRGRTDLQIQQSITHYKRLRTSDVELDLRQRFGESALLPASDLDRPFNVNELRDFSHNRLIFLGNHTKDHAILTNYSAAEIRDQIGRCQQALREMTGKTARIIAYPNGNYSADVRAAALEAGLEFGLAVQPGRNLLPLNSGTTAAMAMKRFTLWGDRSIDAQCRVSRSRLSLYRVFNRNHGQTISARLGLVSRYSRKILENSAGS